MAKSLKLDNNGDLTFNSDGHLEMVEGTDEIKQRIKLGLETNTQEWFLGLDYGISWVQNLGDTNLNELRYELIEFLTSDKDIVAINYLTFDIDRSNRALTVKFSVLLEQGETIEERLEVL